MKKYLIPTLITAALVALLVLLSIGMTGNLWAEIAPATCIASDPGCFCEADRSEAIRQPINTASSLAFVFVGLLILAARARSWMALLGWSSIVIGLGSTFYHISLSFAGQFIDVVGMHMVGALLLVLAFRRFPSWPKRASWAYAGLVASTAAILFLAPDARRYLFAILLLAGIVCEYMLNWRTKGRNFRLLTMSIVTMAAGFAIWILDQTGTLCDATSPVQGHAIWHILGAWALWLLYRYYSTSTLGHR